MKIILLFVNNVYTAPQLSGSIDDSMRDTIVSRLKGLKTEVLQMEKNIKNV